MGEDHTAAVPDQATAPDEAAVPDPPSRLELWITSLARGQTPEGHKTRVVEVQPGAKMKILKSGQRRVGFPDYRAVSEFEGAIIEEVASGSEQKTTSTLLVFGVYQFQPGSVAHCHAKFSGQPDTRVTFVCRPREATPPEEGHSQPAE